ncbi:unnamed protein product [Linum trigynum]|uniref:Uncharacterized protein n=1 Tax=Linum trigynum TaxID=586398 RepID=A0AAV2DI24_9ROSI
MEPWCYTVSSAHLALGPAAEIHYSPHRLVVSPFLLPSRFSLPTTAHGKKTAFLAGIGSPELPGVPFRSPPSGSFFPSLPATLISVRSFPSHSYSPRWKRI